MELASNIETPKRLTVASVMDIVEAIARARHAFGLPTFTGDVTVRDIMEFADMLRLDVEIRFTPKVPAA